MNHDEYLSRVLTFTDGDATAVLAHVDSCMACRRDRRTAERALERLERRPGAGSRFEDAANLAAVAAILAIAIGGLASWNGRSETSPAFSPRVARYRIVGGPEGVVAYTPTETIVAAGGGLRVTNETDPNAKEIRR